MVVPRSPGEDADPQPEKVLGLPFLLIREFAVALMLVAVVFLMGALLSAPLGEAANPGMSPNPTKAPWYFMGFQELLLHFHPVVAVLILPLAGALALITVAYLRYQEDPSGIWFVSRNGMPSSRPAIISGRKKRVCDSRSSARMRPAQVDEFMMNVALFEERAWFPTLMSLIISMRSS